MEKKIFVSLVLFVSSLSFSGCELYDMICSTIKRAFSTDEYDVSVIDPFVASSAGYLVQEQNDFSRYVSYGMRRGVKELSQQRGMAHIRLIDSVPPGEFSKINQIFFSKEKDLQETLGFLRHISGTYSTNILVIGVAAQGKGENAGSFTGWLYRRDLDSISGTPAKVWFHPDLGRREKQQRVAEAIANLLKNSIEDADPVPTPLDNEIIKTIIVVEATEMLKEALNGE